VVAAIFEAKMTPEQAQRAAEVMREHIDIRSPAVVLAALHVDGEDVALVAYWESRAAFDAYLASVEVPGGIQIMRDAGVEPTVRVVDVPQFA
jgi:alkylation response protein AidB-like acyl-CoA dehydrogenase